MKVKMLAEDRDDGFLFLDPDNAPPEAVPYDFSLESGVIFMDVDDDDKVVWMANDSAIVVVPRDSIDFENDPFDKEWPIPTCTICLTTADYDAYQRRRGM